MEEDHNHIK